MKKLFALLLIFAQVSTAFAGNATFIQGPTLIESLSTAATAGGTTTLTNLSNTNQDFSGTLNQTVVLPDATTLKVGRRFNVSNSSSGVLTVRDAFPTTLFTLDGGDYATVVLVSNSTAAGIWASGVGEAPLGFTPEDVANKSTDGTMAANSNTLYPSQQAAKTYSDTKVAKAGDTMTGALTMSELATPATPASGFAAIYPKADGNWYQIDDAGLETVLAGGGGGGGSGTGATLYWSGYHDSDCYFDRTNNAYGNPNADATCTFTETENESFGTVVSYDDGANPLPGITFTPPELGGYYACALVSGYSGNTGEVLSWRLTDGTTTVADGIRGPTGAANDRTTIPVCGIWIANTLTPKTLRIQSAASGAAVNEIRGDTLNRSVQWVIFKMNGGGGDAATYLIAGGDVQTPYTADTDLVYDTIDVDTHGAYDDTTGEYTCPSDGAYRVSASMGGDIANGAQLYFRVAGVDLTTVGDSQSGGIMPSGTRLVYCQQGEIISVRASIGMTTSTAQYNNLSIEKVNAGGLISPSYWSGYHDGSYSWSTTSATFADPTNGAVGTFAERQNVNFGLVTTAASNGSGITFSPRTAQSVYLVSVNVSLYNNTAGGFNVVRLTDGTNEVTRGQRQADSNQGVGQSPLTGIYVPGTTSPVTLKVQMIAYTGTTAFIQTPVDSNTIEWTLTEISMASNNGGGTRLKYTIDGANDSVVQGDVVGNDASGLYSYSGGQNTTASGGKSFAIGTDSTATQTNTFAQGNSSDATGANASAFGDRTLASGTDSHAEGELTQATGLQAHAEGEQTVASGSRSHAQGLLTTASNAESHAEGNSTTASGARAHAGGTGSTAEGTHSFAHGQGAYAQAFAQFAIGRYNILQGTIGSFVAGDDAFIIGNGTGIGSESNAFSVSNDGTLKIYGKILNKEGTAADTSGLATLVAGTVTINTTAVTANSHIFVSVKTPGGTQGFLDTNTRVGGTSFDITSSSATETSSVSWFIVEPN